MLLVKLHPAIVASKFLDRGGHCKMSLHMKRKNRPAPEMITEREFYSRLSRLGYMSYSLNSRHPA